MTGKPKGLRDLESLERVFSGLAHTSRRSILLVLHARGGSMTSKDIADRFDCAWPTITRHLRVLEEAGLVHVEHRGRERVYTFDQEHLVDVAGGWIHRFEPAGRKQPGQAARGTRPGRLQAVTRDATPTRRDHRDRRPVRRPLT